eukprot:gene8475-5951_t
MGDSKLKINKYIYIYIYIYISPNACLTHRVYCIKDFAGSPRFIFVEPLNTPPYSFCHSIRRKENDEFTTFTVAKALVRTASLAWYYLDNDRWSTLKRSKNRKHMIQE